MNGACSVGGTIVRARWLLRIKEKAPALRVSPRREHSRPPRFCRAAGFVSGGCGNLNLKQFAELISTTSDFIGVEHGKQAMDTLRIIGNTDTLRSVRRWLIGDPDARARLRLCTVRLALGHPSRAASAPEPADEAQEAVLVE